MNPQNPASSSNRDIKPTKPVETQIIIEEKVTNSLGESTLKKYTRGKLLGKGGFAKCYEITNLETKKLQAVKVVSKASLQKSRQRAKILSEIKIHRSLHHENVVHLDHVFEDSENVYIILDLCPNQTLNDLIKRRRRLMEVEVQCYVLQILNGIKYLHKNKIIHRDLKLGNFFLSEKMEVKIGDFGLAAKLEFNAEKRHTVCGTPNYIAPEILENRSGHSYEVDVWSLGVIIYTLSVGRPPFETPDVKSTYKKIKMCVYGFPEHIPLSENCKSIVSKILKIDPTKRPDLDEIFNHGYLNQGSKIPRFLPLSTLACPPSGSYLKQYINNSEKVILIFFILFFNLFFFRIRKSGNLTALSAKSATNLPKKKKPSTQKCPTSKTRKKPTSLYPKSENPPH